MFEFWKAVHTHHLMESRGERLAREAELHRLARQRPSWYATLSRRSVAGLGDLLIALGQRLKIAAMPVDLAATRSETTAPTGPGTF